MAEAVEWLRWKAAGGRSHARAESGRAECERVIPATAVPSRGLVCGKCLAVIADRKSAAIPRRKGASLAFQGQHATPYHTQQAKEKE